MASNYTQIPSVSGFAASAVFAASRCIVQLSCCINGFELLLLRGVIKVLLLSHQTLLPI